MKINWYTLPYVNNISKGVSEVIDTSDKRLLLANFILIDSTATTTYLKVLLNEDSTRWHHTLLAAHAFSCRRSTYKESDSYKVQYTFMIYTIPLLTLTRGEIDIPHRQARNWHQFRPYVTISYSLWWSIISIWDRYSCIYLYIYFTNRYVTTIKTVNFHTVPPVQSLSIFISLVYFPGLQFVSSRFDYSTLNNCSQFHNES